jgi:hypothetical protein
MTWTYTFHGYVTTATLAVTAETVAVAEVLIDSHLKTMGLHHTIDRTKLVPMVTHHRFVRIIDDGNM